MIAPKQQTRAEHERERRESQLGFDRLPDLFPVCSFDVLTVCWLATCRICSVAARSASLPCRWMGGCRDGIESVSDGLPNAGGVNSGLIPLVMAGTPGSCPSAVVFLSSGFAAAATTAEDFPVGTGT